jgi:hypothetical protein
MSVINALSDSNKQLLPDSGTIHKYQIIPGWNEYVKEAYSETRDPFMAV